MLGLGGKHFVNAPPTAPVTASSVVTFATTVASSVISWCTMTPDYGVYHNAQASRYVAADIEIRNVAQRQAKCSQKAGP